eukprot:Tbor_TRINITY_DN2885_c0_g1::TRINITY_DN2885_c0_g1_i1::g.23167::m.23167
MPGRRGNRRGGRPAVTSEADDVVALENNQESISTFIASKSNISIDTSTNEEGSACSPMIRCPDELERKSGGSECTSPFDGSSNESISVEKNEKDKDEKIEEHIGLNEPKESRLDISDSGNKPHNGHHRSPKRTAHISAETFEPERTYVEKITTPRRSSRLGLSKGWEDGGLSRRSNQGHSDYSCDGNSAGSSVRHSVSFTNGVDEKDAANNSDRTSEKFSKLCAATDSGDIIMNIDQLCKMRHVHISGDTVDPERHTYVERCATTPIRRSRLSNSCNGHRNSCTMGTTLEELVEERHAHIDTCTADPERGALSKLTTPMRASRRSSQTFGSRSGHSDSSVNDERYARVDFSVEDPVRDPFIENVKSPFRSRALAESCVTLQDYDQYKHAHVDGNVSSPNGMVPRMPTPMRSGDYDLERILLSSDDCSGFPVGNSAKSVRFEENLDDRLESDIGDDDGGKRDERGGDLSASLSLGVAIAVSLIAVSMILIKK